MFLRPLTAILLCGCLAADPLLGAPLIPPTFSPRLAFHPAFMTQAIPPTRGFYSHVTGLVFDFPRAAIRVVQDILAGVHLPITPEGILFPIQMKDEKPDAGMHAPRKHSPVEKFFDLLLHERPEDPASYSKDLADHFTGLTDEDALAVLHGLAWVSDFPGVRRFVAGVLVGRSESTKQIRDKVFSAIEKDKGMLFFWVFEEILSGMEGPVLRDLTRVLFRVLMNPGLTDAQGALFSAFQPAALEADRRQAKLGFDRLSLEGISERAAFHRAAMAQYANSRLPTSTQARIEHERFLYTLELYKAMLLEIRGGRELSHEDIDRGLHERDLNSSEEIAQATEQREAPYRLSTQDLTIPSISRLRQYKAWLEIRNSYLDYLQLSGQGSLAEVYQRETEAIEKRMENLRRSERANLGVLQPPEQRTNQTTNNSIDGGETRHLPFGITGHQNGGTQFSPMVDPWEARQRAGIRAGFPPRQIIPHTQPLQKNRRQLLRAA